MRISTGRRLSQFELDVMLAVGVFAAEVTGAAIAANQDPGGPPFRWWGAGLMAIAATALVFRRRRPFLVSLIVGLATGTYGVAKLPDPPLELALLVRAVHDRVAQRPQGRGAGRRRPVAATVGPSRRLGPRRLLPELSCRVWSRWCSASGRGRGPTTCAPGRAAGRGARARIASAPAERAAADERTHIARELHDVVAHHVA